MSENCSVLPPSAAEYFQEIDHATLGLTIFALILCAGTLAIFGLHVHVVQKLVSKESLRNHLTWLAGMFPTTAIAASAGICIPRSFPAVEVFYILYFTRCLFTFVEMIKEGLGGIPGIKAKMGTSKISLQTQPCCCCCRCLPELNPTVSNLNLLEMFVLQLAPVRALLLFALVLTVSDTGAYSTVDEKALNACSLIDGISALLSLYALTVLNNVAEKCTNEYKVTVLFALLQVILVISDIQGLVFQALVTLKVIPCTSLLPRKTVAKIWDHLLLIGETFLVSLAATWFLRPSVCAMFDKHWKMTRPRVDSQNPDMDTYENKLAEHNKHPQISTDL